MTLFNLERSVAVRSARPAEKKACWVASCAASSSRAIGWEN